MCDRVSMRAFAVRASRTESSTLRWFTWAAQSRGHTGVKLCHDRGKRRAGWNVELELRGRDLRVQISFSKVRERTVLDYWSMQYECSRMESDQCRDMVSAVDSRFVRGLRFNRISRFVRIPRFIRISGGPEKNLGSLELP